MPTEAQAWFQFLSAQIKNNTATDLFSQAYSKALITKLGIAYGITPPAGV